MPKQKKYKILYFTPAISWGILICYFSLMPSKNVPGLLKLVFDGFIHAGIYALLTFLFFLAFSKFKLQNISWFLARIIFGFCALLGLVLEFVQEHLVAGRTFEMSDVIANIIGASFVLLLNFVIQSKLANTK